MRSALLFSLILCGCAGTVAIKPVESDSITFVEGEQNNGVICRHFDASGKPDGLLVKKGFVDRYNFLIGLYGDDGEFFKPLIKLDQGITKIDEDVYFYHVDSMGIYEKLARLARAHIQPKSGWVLQLKKMGLL